MKIVEITYENKVYKLKDKYYHSRIRDNVFGLFVPGGVINDDNYKYFINVYPYLFNIENICDKCNGNDDNCDCEIKSINSINPNQLNIDFNDNVSDEDKTSQIESNEEIIREPINKPKKRGRGRPKKNNN
jgi:hypothetical protein